MKIFVNLAMAFLLLLPCQAAKKERLELNLTKGETYYQRMNSETNVTQTFEGQESSTSILMNILIGYKVVDIKDAIYTVDVAYKSMSMKMNMSMGGEGIEFDSEKEPLAQENDDANAMMFKLFKAMMNETFTMKMSTKGTILEVKGLENVFIKIFENIPELTEEQMGQFQSQLEQTFGEEALKSNFEMISMIFPEKEISESDKWTVEKKQKTIIPMDMKTVYQLKKIEDKSYQIKGNSTFLMNSKDAVTEVEGSTIKYNLTGGSISDMKVDKATGWINTATVNQDISGDIEINSAMKVPMTIKSKMTITNK